MTQETIEKAFPVTAPARLKLSNIRGSVQIEAGDDSQISISATKHLDSGDASRTEIVMAQAEDGKVTVETKFSEWWSAIFNFSKPCKVDYVVRVPHACAVEASVVSSTLSIQSIEGELKASTVSGDMTLKDIGGGLQISSVSGNVSGEGLTGKLNLSTVSGGVRLSGENLDLAKVTTVSGDIHIGTSRGEGPYSFQSVSGNVFLSINQEAGFTVKMHSVSGNLQTALPLSNRYRSGGTLNAEVGGGGIEITMNSVSGDLHLEAPGVSTPQPQSQPDQVSRREVLEQIARGEMSVEEGVEKLKSAG